MSRVIIVGGGISGISAAFYLARRNIPSTLVERRPRLGGVIRTETVDGCVLEAGPDSFLAAKPAALELIRELGLADDVMGSNDHARVTYVVKRGRLVPLPDGLMLVVPTRLWPMAASPLLSWGTKLRMGLEWFRGPGAAPADDRSVADFIADHYGAETVDYLVEPLLAGIYGGDPTQLSVGSVLGRFVELENQYGSLTRGVLAERRKAAGRAPAGPLFSTLKSGLGRLIEAAVAAAGPLLTVVQGEAETVEAGFRVHVSEGSHRSTPHSGLPGFRVRVNGAWLEAPHVVLACPAYEAGALVRGFAGELAGLLDGVAYGSSLTLSLGYDRRALGHPLDGFGFLVPKKERGRLVACTWVGTKFSHRVPEDKAVLRCFLGGGDASALDLGDDALVAAARDELRRFMGVSAEPAFVRIARWPRSMAQYGVGHQKRVERIEALRAAWPGLHLAGNAYTGIGIPDCIRMGKQAAERIAGAGP